MILINEKEYLNLQEQVWRNAETIRCLLSGLKITGTGPTLPPDPEDQDAFLLQQDGKTYLRIYFEADQSWANLGEFPAVGPQGIPGPQGSAATIGAVECSTRTISAGDSASVEVSVDGTNLRFDFEIPQGAVGAQGPRGERGPQGLTGETGPRGPQGETGSSISIAGTLTSSSNLPDPETVPATTAYLVGLTAPYNLYVIVGAAGSRLWKDVGSVTPQNITVDASMSGTSQNPVQNRVVKQYVDAVKTTAEAAYTRSSLNLGRINTIQNVDLPDIFYELADLKEIVFETVADVAAYVVDPVDEFTVPSYITIENVAYPVIDNTDAEVAEILGSTIVWNQYENDNVVTVSTDTERFYKWSGKVIGGHKYLIITQPNIAEIQVFDSPTLGASWADPTGANFLGSIPFSGTSKIVDISSSAEYILLRSALSTISVSEETSWRPNVIDLTAAIPTDTPTSVDDDRVQQLIRYALAHPAYAAPALLDFEMKSIASSKAGEDWESGIDWESVIADSEKLTARSAGSIRDVIYVRDDGNDTFSIVKLKKIGVVDLGTFSWAKQGDYLFFRNSLTPAIKPAPSPNSRMWNILLSDGRYINTFVYSLPRPTGYYVAVTETGGIYFNRPEGPDMTVEQFKAAMSGVYIAYELATPEEVVLASGLLYDQVSFLIKKGGTIAINGGMPDALPGIEIDIPVKRFNE